MLQKILSVIAQATAGGAVLVVLFVTAFEIACYSDYVFYEKEYVKYHVNNEDSIVNMDMSELMDVTVEMMSYLRGGREDLVVYATIDGEEKLFFNEIDQSHMKDVRDLFLLGLLWRKCAIAVLFVSILLLFVLNGAEGGILRLCNGILWSLAALFAVGAAIAGAAVVNFTAVFYAMHRMLFDNDNWLLDPSISRLINILPEGFFVDMGIRIGMWLILLIIFIFVLCFSVRCGMIKRSMKREQSNKQISGGTYEQG